MDRTSEWAEKLDESRCLLVQQSKGVRDSFHRGATFLDRFLSPVKVEQAKVRQPRRHRHIRRLARHAAARDLDLHDVDAGGYNLG